MSAIDDARMLAADAVVWLRDIRSAPSLGDLETAGRHALGLLASRHACATIVRHFETAIAEERARHKRNRPQSQKMAAAGDVE